MDTWPMILAEGEVWPKLIFGAVAVLFWLVSSIAGSIAKKKEEAERRRRMDTIGYEPPQAEPSGPPVLSDEYSARPSPPPLPPPLPTRGPTRGEVRTRAEMERRVEAAKTRRHQGTRSNQPDEEIFSNPSVLNAPTAPPEFDADPEYHARRDALRREQERLMRANEEALTRADSIRVETKRRNKATAVLATQTAAAKAVADAPARKRTGTQSANSTVRVTAEVLHNYLTPATLRQQFILTELLQPPVALRPDRFE